MQIGDVVVYTLSEEDAVQINRRRTSKEVIQERLSHGDWPVGAQAHIGEKVSSGQKYPMIVVRMGPNRSESDSYSHPTINGQVLLDGNDQFHVARIPNIRYAGSKEGSWEERWS